MEELLKKAEQIKIIFFDIDDTLRVKNTAYMPDSINEAFDKLRQKGIMTGIATGRNLYGVVPEVKALKPDYFVTINGAFVMDNKEKVIYKNPFPKTTVEEIIACLEAQDSEYSFVGSDALRVSKWDKVAADAIGPVYAELDEDKDYYVNNDVYQMLSISDHDDRLTLTDDLSEKIRMVRWHENSSDLVPMNGSKAEGCKQVLDLLGLTPENMMNFGDELNDRELFDFAGLSVAMKISHPEILEKADYITDKVENDGILKALQHLHIID
ncbi:MULTISPECIES: Cof-type HAD-IIB family hydrolase [unclassified Lactococcus]|uniref:Cof-type HAD-IIB family hydrolase n=1 Tax=unclassified Lactococcus TaxID=2643510 RepID=UPI0011C9C0FA|nr:MULTISPECIES: Cof-type HAD-IIB family hydrolase [unclassified Lactococcus]MQW22257.1 Cof-type HAD-IIB family hydrolase [Lactococcus sp. dk101]TXK45187.1 Cof-type HAD-IIB family hydrolase [Lactococcus sp. dk310]